MWIIYRPGTVKFSIFFNSLFYYIFASYIQRINEPYISIEGKIIITSQQKSSTIRIRGFQKGYFMRRQVLHRPRHPISLLRNIKHKDPRPLRTNKQHIPITRQSYILYPRPRLKRRNYKFRQILLSIHRPRPNAIHLNYKQTIIHRRNNRILIVRGHFHIIYKISLRPKGDLIIRLVSLTRSTYFIIPWRTIKTRFAV